MFRTNGGLLGVKREASLSNATGVWSLNEQSRYARVTSWPGQSPVPALNPVLWYDFADEFTQTYSGSRLVSISSKGSTAWTLTGPTSGPSKGTWTNGLTCCDFGSSPSNAYLRNTTTTATGIAEIYVVLDGAFGASFPNNNAIITDVTDVGSSELIIYGTGTTFTLTGLNTYYLNNSATANTAPLPTINSPCLMRINKADGTTFTTTDGFQIGNDRSNFNLNRNWYGLFGEVVAFGSNITGANRTLLQSYFASKWGLTLA